MTDYGTIFSTLGAEFKNQRKAEAVFENFHFVDQSDDAKRLASAVYSDSDVYQEAANAVASRTYEFSVAAGMQNVCTALRGAFEQGWFPVLDSKIATNPSDKSAGAIQYNYDGSLNDGTVAILSRLGRWGALRDRMIADGIVIAKNTFSVGLLTPVGENQGQISLVSISPSDHTLTGIITIVCVDDTVEALKFSVSNVLTNKIADQTVQVSQDGLVSFIDADNQASLGRSFEDGPTGLSLLLAYHDGDLIDPSAVIVTSPMPTVLNPTEADTNKGTLYFTAKRLSAEPIWKMSWFRDAARTDLVTSATSEHADGTFFLLSPGGTSVTIALDVAAADIAMPSAGDSVATIQFNLMTPRVNDQWTISIENIEDGVFATKLARRYRASLNSAGAASDTVPSVSMAGAGAGNVNNGTHSYYYSYVINGVETGVSGTSNVLNVVDKSLDGKVEVIGITVGPTGTTARKIYRKVAGNTGSPLLLATIADNTTVAYTDNIADSSLGAAALIQIDDTLAASVSMI